MVKSLERAQPELFRSKTLFRSELNCYNVYRGVIEIMMRDRFELLSAYLDGEVTPSERSQVEEWLRTDEELRGLYHRLLRLHSSLQEMPIPVSNQSSDDVIQSVFQKIDAEKEERKVWRVGAFAALLVGALSGVGLVLNGTLNPEFAKVPDSTSSEEVAIRIDQPVVEIVTPTVPINDAVLTINEPVIEIPQP